MTCGATDRLTVLSDVCGLLACPVCGRGFTLTPSALRCASGHSFDIARQGYVSLMPGGARPGTADTAEMVAARQAFLSAGHYAPLAQAVAGLAASPLPLAEAPPGPAAVLDAGAGPGYYLAAVLVRLQAGPAAASLAVGPDLAVAAGPVGPVGLAMDISARALRRAARAHPAIGAVAWDVWKPLPVRDGAVSVIVNVFAPRNGPEFHRVLRRDGALIVVTPAPGHLAELVSAAGLLTVDPRKDERLAAALGAHFMLTQRQELTIPLQLSQAEAATLIGMGPTAWHTDPDETRARLADLAVPVSVTAAFELSVYQPR